MTYYSNLSTQPFTVRWPTSSGTVLAPTIDGGSYCAQTLADAIHTSLYSLSSGALSFEFDNSSYVGRYFITSGAAANFDLISIHADYAGILGTYTANNIDHTAANLNIDPRTYFLKRGVHWESPTQVLPSTIDLAQTGRALGRSYGSAVGYQTWNIEFISNSRAAHELASPTVYDQLEASLDRYAAGSKMRVYLNWTVGSKDTAVWSTSNTDGYIDIVSPATDSVDYEWTSKLLKYANVRIAGMQE